MIKNNTTELQEILSKVQSLPRKQILQDNKNIVPKKETQIILPDEGYDALAKVIVQGDENLLAENIKEGINIFGVTGTLNINSTASLLSLFEEQNEEIIKYNIDFKFNNIYSETLVYFYYLNNQEIIFNPQNISIDLNNITISSFENSLVFIMGEALVLEESELPCYYIGQNNELYNMYLIGATNNGTVIFQKNF